MNKAKRETTLPFLYEHMNFAPFQKMAAVVRFKEHTTSMQDGCRKSALQVAMVIFCPFILKRFFYVHLYHAGRKSLNLILMRKGGTDNECKEEFPK